MAIQGGSRLHSVEISFILSGIVQVPMNQLFRHDFFVQKWGTKTKYNIDKYP